MQIHINQLTITEGALVESSRPAASSLNIASPSKIISPNKTLIIHQRLQDINQVEHNTQWTCRICLQPCNNIQYCMCTGGMLCHHQCLKHYLQNTNKTSNKQKCQVCKFPYQLILQRQCICSHLNIKQKIILKPFKCALYTLFFVLTLATYGYLLKLLINQQLKKDIITIAIAVLACLTIMLLFFLIIWTCQYAILSKITVQSIVPLNQQQVKIIRKLSKTLSSSSSMDISVQCLN